MINTVGLRLSQQKAFQRGFQRNFQSSSRACNNIFGTPKEGPYSNLPFKVKDRVIPFKFAYWGLVGAFFAFPFMSTYWHLKKAGSFEMAE
ncbi:uncharacterized protein PRCAT00004754001 [Priceomyces carsonii]|uniref:uncharacterized protein n=1 Tax=Priceomyces carsonii TaxID=28549 RepID=UPI002EDAE7DE|nr:unnamed protein product [Priceomyces carsonii]